MWIQRDQGVLGPWKWLSNALLGTRLVLRSGYIYLQDKRFRRLVVNREQESEKAAELEVFTGLGLAAQTIFGSWPGSNDRNQTLYSGFLGPFFFRKEKVIRSCTHLMLVIQSGSGNKSHGLGFIGDFRSCPLPETVPDNTLQTWHPISVYRSSNAKITSDVLRASLNN
jgi:hypothetical protein